jgi:hypothetical protein
VRYKHECGSESPGIQHRQMARRRQSLSPGVAVLRPYEETSEARREYLAAMKKAGAGRARRNSKEKLRLRFSRDFQNLLALDRN